MSLISFAIHLSKYSPFGGLLRIYGQDIARIQRIIDPIVLTLVFTYLEPKVLWSTPFASVPFWGLVFVFIVLVLPSSSIYTSYRRRSLYRLIRQITSSWLLILALLLLATYFNKSTAYLSRVSTSTWALFGWCWLVTIHGFGRKFLRWYRIQGGNSRSIVYWGTPEAVASFSSQLTQNSWLGFYIQAWFSPVFPRSDFDVPDLPLCGGGIFELKEWLSSNHVDRLIVSDFNSREMSMQEMIALFGDTSIPVMYAPQWSHPTMRFTFDTIGTQPCFDLWGCEPSYLDRQIKRCFDLLLTSIGVVVISPLLLLIAIAVKLSSSGPILYKQVRYGLDGKPFQCFKYRTMRVLDSPDQTIVKQATADDPRITPFGSFLRRWSLDELPQVFNVLCGDMSLVGPRPHAVQHNEIYRKLIPGYMQRHAYKPGITGLAQVSGWRGETRTVSDMENRIYADLTYQRDWSLFLDIKILIKTFLRLRSGNAY